MLFAFVHQEMIRFKILFKLPCELLCDNEFMRSISIVILWMILTFENYRQMDYFLLLIMQNAKKHEVSHEFLLNLALTYSNPIICRQSCDTSLLIFWYLCKVNAIGNVMINERNYHVEWIFSTGIQNVQLSIFSPRDLNSVDEWTKTKM